MEKQELEKLTADPKFLSELKRAALNHRDDPIPNKDGEYYASMMWAKGMVDVLTSRGLKIVQQNEV